MNVPPSRLLRVLLQHGSEQGCTRVDTNRALRTPSRLDTLRWFDSGEQLPNRPPPCSLFASAENPARIRPITDSHAPAGRLCCTP